MVTPTSVKSYDNTLYQVGAGDQKTNTTVRYDTGHIMYPMVNMDLALATVTPVTVNPVANVTTLPAVIPATPVPIVPVTTIVTPSNIPANVNMDRPSQPATCPNGYNLINGTCIRPIRTHPVAMTLALCPAGYSNNGTVCVRLADSQSSPSILATCPQGYSNNGIGCQNDADSYVKGCSVPGGTIYPCREGFTDMGCYCQLTTGIRTIPLDNATCPAGYARTGNRCYPICPLNYVRQGEECVRAESTLDSQYMTCPAGTFRQNANCYQICEPEFVFKNGVCESPVDIKGPEVMVCSTPYPELIGTNCYGVCPIGTQPLGTSCVTRV